MAWKKTSIQYSTVDETIPLEIIGDGSIMITNKFEGKMIPAIIFNKDQKPSLTELIRVHQHTDSGDIISTWQKPVYGKDRCELIISFQKPIILKVRIVFKVSTQFNLVYLILKNKALYIIPGVPGNRMIHVMDSPKILAEIPTTVSIEEWERFFIFTLKNSKLFSHLPKKQRLQLAESSVEKMREIAEIRKKNA